MKTSIIKVYGDEKEIFKSLDNYMKKDNGKWYKKDIEIEDFTSSFDKHKRAALLKISHPNNYKFASEMDKRDFDFLVFDISNGNLKNPFILIL